MYFTLKILPALILMFPSNIYGCFHANVKVVETKKESIVFHDGKYAHLIISTGVKTKGKKIRNISWIIPLPTVPHNISQIHANIFDEIPNTTLLHSQIFRTSLGIGCSNLGPMKKNLGRNHLNTASTRCI